MLTRKAIGNLINRYSAVLKKCALLNAGIVTCAVVCGGLCIDIAHAEDDNTVLYSKDGYSIEEKQENFSYKFTFTVDEKSYNSNGTIQSTTVTYGVTVDSDMSFSERIGTNQTGDISGNFYKQSNTGGNGGAVSNSSNGSNLSTVSGYFFSNEARQGAGLYNSGSSTIALVTADFVSNEASYKGGAICNGTNSEITLLSGYFTANTAGEYGGAVYNDYNATIGSIEDSIFYGNVASTSGGAIYNGSTTTVSNIGNIEADFTYNTATSGSGGAIYNAGNVGNISSGEISYNTAGTSGGAIYNINSMGSITVTGDVAYNTAGTGGGGAIYNSGTMGSITADSIDYNTSTGQAGAIYNTDTGTIEANEDGISIQADFTGNSAGISGGAIRNDGTIEGLIVGDFTDNEAGTETGNFGGGGAIVNSGTIGGIVGDFTDNTAWLQGGAIYSAGTINYITSESFSGNIAGTSGGAIYNSGNIGIITACLDDDNAILKTTFSGNTSTYAGGAIYNSKTIADTTVDDAGDLVNVTTINDVTYYTVGGIYADFTDNEVTDGGYNQGGGAILNEGDIANIVGDFTGNSYTNSGYGSAYTNSYGVTYTGNYSGGGAIYNSGTIYTISGSFKDNTATFAVGESYSGGGAIFNYTGDIYAIEGDFTNNKVINGTDDDGIGGSGGGAILNFAWSAGQATIGYIDGNFTSNEADGSGGAISNVSADNAIASIGSIVGDFDDNKSINSSGGAIANSGANASIGYIIGSFANNEATGSGGAIVNAFGSIGYIEGTNFTSNTSGTYGGAIYSSGSIGYIIGGVDDDSNITSATFSKNTATYAGGAIYNKSGIDYDGIIADTSSSEEIDGITYYTDGGIYANFTGNEVTDGGYAQGGGAVYNSGDIANIVGDFTSNSYTNTGSGYEYNTYTGNYSGGGAVYNSGTIYTITGSFTDNTATFEASQSYSGGGAIYNDAGEIYAITANFEGNESSLAGGAIYSAARNGMDATIDSIYGSFTSNTAGTNGGAIYNSTYTASSEGSATASIGIITGSFTSNEATNGSGGAIYNYGANSSYTASIETILADFIGNIAGTNGGAISNAGSNASITTIGYTEQGDSDDYATWNWIYFFGNEADLYGGAIYNSGSIDTISNALFGSLYIEDSGNSSTSGGAIYNTSTIDTITYSSFANNTASDDGGAIYNSGDIEKISYSEFNNNTSTGDGGALYNASGATINLFNVAFNDNTSTAGNGGAIYNAGALTYTVTESYTNERNYAQFEGVDEVDDDGFGGFLYAASGSTTTFDVVGVDTELTIGQPNVTGSRYGSIYTESGSVFIKTGEGRLLMRSNFVNHGTLIVANGRLVIEGDIGQEADGTYWYDNVYATLQKQYGANFSNYTILMVSNPLLVGDGLYVGNVSEEITGVTVHEEYEDKEIGDSETQALAYSLMANTNSIALIDEDETSSTTNTTSSSTGNAYFASDSILAVHVEGTDGEATFDGKLEQAAIKGDGTGTLTVENGAVLVVYGASTATTKVRVAQSFTNDGDNDDLVQGWGIGEDGSFDENELIIVNPLVKLVTQGFIDDDGNGIYSYYLGIEPDLEKLGEISQLAAVAAVPSNTASIATSAMDASGARFAIPNYDPELERGFNVWAIPLFSSVYADDFASSRNGAVKNSGYDTTYGGLNIGADYTTHKGYRFGIGLHAGYGETESHGDYAKTENDFSFWGLTLYGGRRWDKFSLYADVNLSMTKSDLSQENGSFIAAPLYGEVNAYAFTAEARADYQVRTDFVDVLPHAGLRYMNLVVDGYDINQLDYNICHVGSSMQDMLIMPVGVQFSHDFVFGEKNTAEYAYAHGQMSQEDYFVQAYDDEDKIWTLKPRLDLGVIFSIGELDSTSTAYLPESGTSQSMTMETFDGVAYAASLGVDLKHKNTTFALEYGTRFSEHQLVQNVSFTWRYAF